MSEQKTGPSNAAQIEFWNSAASRAWADEHERMDRAVAKVTEALLDMAAPLPGELPHREGLCSFSAANWAVRARV